jgi:glutaryl-CoA dehydrogenase (non-decarboxylating)
MSAPQVQSSAQGRRWQDFVAVVARHADKSDAEQQLAPPVLALMRESGVLGMTVAERHGGWGWTAHELGWAHHTLGRQCNSARAVLTAHQLVVEALARAGSPAQIERWMPELARGMLGAFAISEEDAGSNPGKLRAEVVRDGSQLRLNGTKRWITGGQSADLILTTAKLDGLPSVFLVQPGAVGVLRTPVKGMLGLGAALLAQLTFQDTQLAAESMVGEPGTALSLPVAAALDLGRFVTAWGAAGIQSECYRIARDFAFREEADGGRRIRHQLVRRLLADMVTRQRASELLCLDAADRRQGRTDDAIEATIIAKYAATRNASRVASAAIQVMGATGCAAGVVQRLFRDARILELIEGTNEVLQDSIGVAWHREVATCPK